LKTNIITPIEQTFNISIQQSDILIGLILIGLILLIWFGLALKKFIKNVKRLKKMEEELIEEDRKKNQIINLIHGQEVLSFLESLIKDKYQYYLYQDLLPIYLDSKIPERTVVKKVKEKVYASIVGSLTTSVKQEILRFFTEKGIEILVNEKIITYMNETDFRASDKLNESFREINASNVSRVI